MITASRIVEAQFADVAFEGGGARIAGGRWNSPGTPIVYTSGNISLATLELLVRIIRGQDLPEYVVLSCSFPEAIVESVDRSRLPANWRSHPAPPELQQIGDEWALSRSSAVLEVPSAITEAESNYLLNPEHEDFRSIDIGQARPFKLDFRLLT